MDAEQSKVCMIDAWNAFTTRDQAAIAGCFSDDAEWLAPAGSATASTLHMVFELRDGRSQRVREYIDTLRAQRQVFGHPG